MDDSGDTANIGSLTMAHTRLLQCSLWEMLDLKVCLNTRALCWLIGADS